jgi:hypothetical protein
MVLLPKFIQENGEIELAGGVTIIREQSGGFTAMLRTMINDMQERMPQDSVALDSTIDRITQMTFHILIA